MQSGKLLSDSWHSKKVNAKASSDVILDSWASLVNSILTFVKNNNVHAIGIAMPGPFDYEKGICLINGLDKYQDCYGIQVIESLRNRLHLTNRNMPVIINNDAHCFAVG